MICTIPVKVSFLKHTITIKSVGVVEGDYNTTKFVFEFEEDVSGQRIVLKMRNPEGEPILMKDLTDNEVVLAGFDEEGKAYSLFNTSGPHPFELVLYGENSKLTSATGWLAVSERQVDIGDGETFKGYLPALDQALSGVGRGIVEITIEEVYNGQKNLPN